MDDAAPGSGENDSELQLLSRAELEDRVRERTASLRNLMDTMADILLVLDAEGNVVRTNAAMTEVLGYDEETVVGKPVDFLFADPDDDDQLSEALTEAQLTERLLTEGQVTDVEVSFECASGDTIAMSLSASVMTDDDSLSGIVCVAKDISERKEAERRAEFLHSVLRHDLGNKLQVTKGYLDVLEQAAGDHSDIVEEIRRGIDEAVELVENVRTLHRLDGEEERDPVSLAVVLQSCVDRHTDLARQKDVEVDVEDSAMDAGQVLAGALLKELFGNLVENALVHSEGDRIRISAREDDGWVVVTIEDDGKGVPDDRKEEILQRGVKGPGSEGSGLGMHLVDRIADQYGDGIDVLDSELGGARFDVYLEPAN